MLQQLLLPLLLLPLLLLLLCEELLLGSELLSKLLVRTERFTGRGPRRGGKARGGTARTGFKELGWSLCLRVPTLETKTRIAVRRVPVYRVRHGIGIKREMASIQQDK
jgi:hypothetical protein